MIVFDGCELTAFAPAIRGRLAIRFGLRPPLFLPRESIKFNLFSRLTPVMQENTVALITADNSRRSVKNYQRCLMQYSRGSQRRRA